MWDEFWRGNNLLSVQNTSGELDRGKTADLGCVLDSVSLVVASDSNNVGAWLLVPHLKGNFLSESLSNL